MVLRVINGFMWVIENLLVVIDESTISSSAPLLLVVMDNITGWATGIWAKQKLNGLGSGKENEESKTPSMRSSIAEQRAERDAEAEKRKAERASTKTSVTDKWKANKQKK